MISFSSKTFLSAGLLAVVLLFSQCGGGDNEENSDAKVQSNTNLTDDQPLELSSDEYQNLDKKILLATLNRQKMLVEYRIEALQNAPGNSADASTLEGNVQQLKVYKKKLDSEIAKVRNAGDNNLGSVEETAQAAIKGAGALMSDARLLLKQGF